MQHNEYDVTVVKVVDGDTVDVDIDLGFGVTLTDERVRIMGIDTPEYKGQGRRLVRRSSQSTFESTYEGRWQTYYY